MRKKSLGAYPPVARGRAEDLSSTSAAPLGGRKVVGGAKATKINAKEADDLDDRTYELGRVLSRAKDIAPSTLAALEPVSRGFHQAIDLTTSTRHQALHELEHWPTPGGYRALADLAKIAAKSNAVNRSAAMMTLVEAIGGKLGRDPILRATALYDLVKMRAHLSPQHLGQLHKVVADTAVHPDTSSLMVGHLALVMAQLRVVGLTPILLRLVENKKLSVHLVKDFEDIKLRMGEKRAASTGSWKLAGSKKEESYYRRFEKLYAEQHVDVSDFETPLFPAIEAFCGRQGENDGAKRSAAKQQEIGQDNESAFFLPRLRVTYQSLDPKLLLDAVDPATLSTVKVLFGAMERVDATHTSPEGTKTYIDISADIMKGMLAGLTSPASKPSYAFPLHDVFKYIVRRG